MRMDVQLTSMGEITHDQQEYMDHTPYMNMIGALRYAADQTCPDILYVMGQLARHLQKYNSNHYLATKHVFQYLKGSSDMVDMVTLQPRDSVMLLDFARRW